MLEGPYGTPPLDRPRQRSRRYYPQNPHTQLTYVGRWFRGRKSLGTPPSTMQSTLTSLCTHGVLRTLMATPQRNNKKKSLSENLSGDFLSVESNERTGKNPKKRQPKIKKPRRTPKIKKEPAKNIIQIANFSFSNYKSYEECSKCIILCWRY